MCAPLVITNSCFVLRYHLCSGSYLTQLLLVLRLGLCFCVCICVHVSLCRRAWPLCWQGMVLAAQQPQTGPLTLTARRLIQPNRHSTNQQQQQQQSAVSWQLAVWEQQQALESVGWHVVGGGVEAGCGLLAQLASTQGEAEGSSCGPLGETVGDCRWVDRNWEGTLNDCCQHHCMCACWLGPSYPHCQLGRQ
jgi:hypothetical protein